MAPKRRASSPPAAHDPTIKRILAPSVDGDTVTVLVGAEKRKFLVHEAPLCAHSRFFAAAMSGSWLESTERVINLPMETPEVFTLYVQWVYTNKIAVPDDWGHGGLVSLYIAALRLQDGDLQDASIDCMIRRICSVHRRPLSSVIDLLYDNTAEGDNARKVQVDCWVLRADETWLNTTNLLVDNKQYFFDFALAGVRVRDGVKPKLIDDNGSTCKYHQHGDNECYSKKYAA